MKVVIINGSATSGKNEFVAMVDRIARQSGWFTFQHSTVDRVKEAMEMFFGYPGDHAPGAKTDEARAFMSALKDAWTEYNNGPFVEAVKLAAVMKARFAGEAEGKLALFIHAREPKEIKKLADHFGTDCVTLLVKAHLRVDHVPNNHADREVGQYGYDVIVENNAGLDDLQQEAEGFFKRYFL